MRYRLQRHDGTDCSATMVPITVLRMVPIQRYRHSSNIRCCSSLCLSKIIFWIYSLLGQLGLGLFRVKSQYLGLMVCLNFGIYAFLL